MKLSELKNYFLNRLKSEYEPEEARSFFYLLTEAYLKMQGFQVALEPDKKLDKKQLAHFETALSGLLKYEPIQYILGKTSFCGLEFKLNPHVLIPRPETEELVHWILSDIEKQNSPLQILDIGTGSGCIAISLAKNLPRARVTALDVSQKALETAKENAKINTVKIDFLQADILEMPNLSPHYDLIVSNPPYVRESEKTLMQRNVLEYEPKTALYVQDSDPLLFYRKIANLAETSLKRGGGVYMEINQYLGKETEEIFKKKKYSTKLRKDIFGNLRMLKAWGSGEKSKDCFLV